MKDEEAAMPRVNTPAEVQKPAGSRIEYPAVDPGNEEASEWCVYSECEKTLSVFLQYKGDQCRTDHAAESYGQDREVDARSLWITAIQGG